MKLPSCYTALDAAFVAAIARDDQAEAARLELLVEHYPPSSPKELPPISAALWYAETGWPVFPCQPGGKQPATPHGFKDATTNTEQIRTWWTETPDANIGLPTGSTSGIDVFDFDGDPDGVKEFNTKAIRGGLPRLAGAAATPRGMHLYIPATGRGNAAGIFPGVDYRGDGGYVIIPCSRTPAGIYQWLLPLERPRTA